MYGSVLAGTPAGSAGTLGILAAVAVCTLLECSVGLGIVLPAETVVVGAAAAAANDLVPLWSVFLVAWVCGVAGDSAGFTIGRRWGRRLIDRYGPRVGLTPERAGQADRIVARWGALAVAGGRFLPAVRILVMPTAGISDMPWRRFLVADACGVAGWAALHAGLGYLLGLGLDRATGGWLGVALAIAVVATIGWLAVRHRRQSPTAGEDPTGGPERHSGSHPTVDAQKGRHA